MSPLVARAVSLVVLIGSLLALRLAVGAYRGDLLAGRLAREGPDLSAREYRELSAECLRSNPGAWSPLVPMANDLARKGDATTARAIVEEALRRHRPVDALLLEATFVAQSRGAGAALPLAESLRRLSPGSRPIAQLLLGLAAASDDPRLLARVARDIDVSWPGSFDALVALSDLAAKDGGDPSEAVRLLEAALEADPRARPRPAVYDLDERREALRGFREGDRP